MAAQTTILSILGLEHSGTTVLVRVLNNHSDAAAIGGIKNVSDFAARKRTCSCGKNGDECSFWSNLADEFSKRGCTLGQVAGAIKDGDKRIIRDFFESAAVATGKSMILESSRQPSYLDLLPGPPDFLSVAVHIFKHPGSQAWSAFRAGRSVLREMRHYRRRSRAILKRLSQHPAAIHISHDEFCTVPGKSLRRILVLAGRQPDAGQLENWGGKAMHIIGGNRMKKDTSSVIKADDSWRHHLPLLHRITARVVGSSAYRDNLAATSA